MKCIKCENDSVFASEKEGVRVGLCSKNLVVNDHASGDAWNSHQLL